MENKNHDFQNLERVLIPVIKSHTEEDKAIWKEIDNQFKKALKAAKLSFIKRFYMRWLIKNTMEKDVKEGVPFAEIDKKLRLFFAKKLDMKKVIYPNAVKRAQKNFKKIREYIIGNSVLDLGAGDGLLSKEIKDKLNKEVTLVDVLDCNLTDLTLKLYTQSGTLPLEDKSIDTTIIYLVLHHCDAPEKVLKEACRVTRKRLIIMEGYGDNGIVVKKNSYFDWLYNRILRDLDINVPLNYKSANEWEKTLHEFGFKLQNKIDLGIDEPVAPEHHILFVADSKSG